MLTDATTTTHNTLASEGRGTFEWSTEAGLRVDHPSLETSLTALLTEQLPLTRAARLLANDSVIEDWLRAHCDIDADCDLSLFHNCSFRLHGSYYFETTDTLFDEQDTEFQLFIESASLRLDVAFKNVDLSLTA